MLTGGAPWSCGHIRGIPVEAKKKLCLLMISDLRIRSPKICDATLDQKRGSIQQDLRVAQPNEILFWPKTTSKLDRFTYYQTYFYIVTHSRIWPIQKDISEIRQTSKMVVKYLKIWSLKANHYCAHNYFKNWVPLPSGLICQLIRSWSGRPGFKSRQGMAN